MGSLISTTAATAMTTAMYIMFGFFQCVVLAQASAIHIDETPDTVFPSIDSGSGYVPPSHIVEPGLDDAAAATSTSFKGYELVPAQFVGSLLGQEVRLNGTVQEVMAHLQEKYNGVDSFDDENCGTAAAAGVGNLSSSSGGRSDAVGKRNKKFPATCLPVPGTDWKFAMGPATDDNVRLLERIGGRVVLGAHQCIRLACSGSSAIFLCNDNTFKIDPSIVYISTYASDLRHQCIARVNNPKMDLCGGVLTDTDRYEVIVRYDRC